MMLDISIPVQNISLEIGHSSMRGSIKLGIIQFSEYHPHIARSYYMSLTDRYATFEVAKVSGHSAYRLSEFFSGP